MYFMERNTVSKGLVRIKFKLNEKVAISDLYFPACAITSNDWRWFQYQNKP
jgi:hypothetical protein